MPRAKHHEVWATIVKAQEAMLSAMCPGVRASYVFASGNRVLAAMGFGRPSQYCGHGIGVDVVEPPFLSAAGDHLLQPGMVLALEPWISEAQGLGIFGLGEMVTITEDGYDLLSALPREELWATNA
jgi:Xaa-Pro aminopeptidase